ncbi:ATP-dependent Clp protease proteolytic subunit [Nonomuraea dietziae]
MSDQLYQRLLRERIIVLGTDVNDEIANRICAAVAAACRRRLRT